MFGEAKITCVSYLILHGEFWMVVCCVCLALISVRRI